MSTLSKPMRSLLLATIAVCAVGAFSAHAGDSRDICDTLAASGNDVTRPAGVAGIHEDDIDVAKALPACKAAYDGSNKDPRLAFQLARVLGKDGKKAEAIALYEEAAKTGHVAAMVNLGVETEDANPTQAVFWYTKAAEAGNVIGQYNLGVAYQDAIGIAANGKLALEWLGKASAQGDGVAAYNMAVINDEGKLVPGNKVEAVRLYKIAVERDVVDAMINLAIVYENGEGVPVDTTTALELYKKAAMLGDTEGADNAKRLEAEDEME